MFKTSYQNTAFSAVAAILCCAATFGLTTVVAPAAAIATQTTVA